MLALLPPIRAVTDGPIFVHVFSDNVDAYRNATCRVDLPRGAKTFEIVEIVS